MKAPINCSTIKRLYQRVMEKLSIEERQTMKWLKENKKTKIQTKVHKTRYQRRVFRTETNIITRQRTQ